MGRKTIVFWAKSVVILATVPLLIYAYEFGPDPGNSGAPGESTCAACHIGTALNGGGGSVAIAFPNGLSYTPGVSQHVTVTVSDPGAKRYGFQVTARLASDSTTTAGNFAPSDGRTQVLCSAAPLFAIQIKPPCPASAPLQYIEHTLAGYQAASSTYQFDWTPPATDAGPIIFYVAGNAANGDLTSRGDHIYTTTATLASGSAGGGGAPTITLVENAAGFQPSIAAGSWVVIQGTNLSTITRTWRADDFVNGALPPQLDGVSAQINGKSAYVYYISPTQLNVQAPSDSAVGPVSVTVTNAAGASAPATVQLAAVSPAFFPWQGKYAVATRTDFSLVGLPGLLPGLTTVPAKPGDIILLWGTGFGATNPAFPAGQTVTGAPALVANPTVTVGGVNADIVAAVLSPASAGLYLIAIRVPATATNGDLPVVAAIGGVQSPDGIFLTVQQ